jgi:2-polyprenyl-3-methyl-5-hydroxy-6-metoxy-1,4-benzoquinol methylase
MATSKTNPPCIVCNSESWEAQYEEGLLVKCVNCGLIRAKVVPLQKDLGKYYEQEYFFGQEYTDYEADRPALEANFKYRINVLNKVKNLKKNQSAFEIGCAYGYFTKLIADKGITITGYDITEDGIRFAKDELGVDAQLKEVTAIKDQTAKHDWCFAWDVAEHVRDPYEYFSHAATMLKKGGILSLTTGDIGKFVPRIRKGGWRMIHPPTHLYYFDKKSMTELLAKCGFEIVFFRYPATRRNVGSIISQLAIKSKLANRHVMYKAILTLEKIAKASGLAKINISLNTRDIMFVAATKR